jgi:peptidyl-prolyl cis-trans isomerase B (cyclophilin B)
MKKLISITISLLFLVTVTIGQPIEQNDSRTILQIETNYGDIFIRLFTKEAPITSSNFLNYVKDKYYNNTIFHRIIPGFIIQGGGFERGLISKPFNDPIENESKQSKKNTKGTLAMALNRDTENPSAATQFYINLADNTDLDYSARNIRGYTVFAEIIDGMNIVEKISKVRTRDVNYYSDLYNRSIMFYDYPENEVYIKQIKILNQ